MFKINKEKYKKNIITKIILTYENRIYLNAIKGYADSDMESYYLHTEKSDYDIKSNILFLEMLMLNLQTIPLPYSVKENDITYKLDITNKTNDIMLVKYKDIKPKIDFIDGFITTLGPNESISIKNIKIKKRKNYDKPYLTKFMFKDNSLIMDVILYESDELCKKMIIDILNNLINKFIEIKKTIKNKSNDMYSNYIKSDNYIKLEIYDREYIKSLLIYILEENLPDKGGYFENNSNPDDNKISFTIKGDVNIFESILLNSIEIIINEFEKIKKIEKIKKL